MSARARAVFLVERDRDADQRTLGGSTLHALSSRSLPEILRRTARGRTRLPDFGHVVVGQSNAGVDDRLRAADTAYHVR